LAKVIVISDIQSPGELGMVLDKALGQSQCPLMNGMPTGGMVKVAEGVVTGASLSDFLKGMGVEFTPKQNPIDPKNNKGGKS